MKRTITILVVALMTIGFASCMDAGSNVNENPLAVGPAAYYLYCRR